MNNVELIDLFNKVLSTYEPGQWIRLADFGSKLRKIRPDFKEPEYEDYRLIDLLNDFPDFIEVQREEKPPYHPMCRSKGCPIPADYAHPEKQSYHGYSYKERREFCFGALANRFPPHRWRNFYKIAQKMGSVFVKDIIEEEMEPQQVCEKHIFEAIIEVFSIDPCEFMARINEALSEFEWRIDAVRSAEKLHNPEVVSKLKADIQKSYDRGTFLMLERMRSEIDSTENSFEQLHEKHSELEKRNSKLEELRSAKDLLYKECRENELTIQNEIDRKQSEYELFAQIYADMEKNKPGSAQNFSYEYLVPIEVEIEEMKQRIRENASLYDEQIQKLNEEIEKMEKDVGNIVTELEKRSANNKITTGYREMWPKVKQMIENLRALDIDVKKNFQTDVI